MRAGQSHARRVVGLAALLFFGAAAPFALAQSVPPGLLPAGANTTNPTAPFYIDLTGLDFRTNPPTRNPLNPNYPSAIEIANGRLPPIASGNFIIGPTHPTAPEVTTIPTGKVYSFTMRSNDSKIYPTGLVRVEPYFDYINQYGQTAPGDFSTLLLPNCFSPDVKYCSEVGTWTRVVKIYVPRQARDRGDLPFIVSGDGNTSFPGSDSFESLLFPTLDNLIQQRRIPPMVAITVENGGQDAQGSQRGFEYDSMNGLYAEFVDTEVLPLVEKVAGLHLTRNPAGRIAMGGSASGEAAFTMAWFHPELFGKVLSYSRPLPTNSGRITPTCRAGPGNITASTQAPSPIPYWKRKASCFCPPGQSLRRNPQDRPSSPTAPRSRSGCGTSSATTTAGFPIRWRTRCTIMCSLARTWPRCWQRKGTSTSSSSPAMPGMVILPR